MYNKHFHAHIIIVRYALIYWVANNLYYYDACKAKATLVFTFLVQATVITTVSYDRNVLIVQSADVKLQFKIVFARSVLNLFFRRYET
jgi:hypothetical protein